MREKKILSDVTFRSSNKRMPLSDVLRKGDTRSPVRSTPKVAPPKVLVKNKENEHFFTEPVLSSLSYEKRGESEVVKTKSLLKRTAWFSIPLVIIVGVYLVISVLFSGAELKIVSRFEKLQVSVPITAKKGDLKAGMPFEIVTLSDEQSRLVAPTGTKEISEKAGGRVIIYNAYSSASQKLLKETRLETTDGKIYRIDVGVTVPGLKTVNGEIIPGSVEVSIHADKAGEQYNVGLSDFSITGFKGDPRYDKFYARSKGEIKGGYVGSVQTASPTAVSSARNELRTAIKESLVRQISSQIPETYILYKDAGNISFETKDDVKNGSGVIVKEKGTYTGMLLPKDTLAKEIIKEAKYSMKDVSEVVLKNLEGLSFAFEGVDSSETLSQATSIGFTLNGEVTAEAFIDSGKIKKDIAGKPRSEFNALLANYKGIETATLSMNPFWARYIPTSEDKITIVQDSKK
jgi:hypothetical protein